MDFRSTKTSVPEPRQSTSCPSPRVARGDRDSLISRATTHLASVVGTISSWWSTLSENFAPADKLPILPDKAVTAIDEYGERITAEEQRLLSEIVLAEQLQFGKSLTLAVAQSRLAKLKERAGQSAEAQRQSRETDQRREIVLLRDIEDLKQELRLTEGQLAGSAAQLSRSEQVPDPAQRKTGSHELQPAQIDDTVQQAGNRIISEPVQPVDGRSPTVARDGRELLRARATAHVTQVVDTITAWWSTVSGLFAPAAKPPLLADHVVTDLDEYEKRLAAEELRLLDEIVLAEQRQTTSYLATAGAQADLVKRKKVAEQTHERHVLSIEKAQRRELVLLPEIEALKQDLRVTEEKLAGPASQLAVSEQVTDLARAKTDRHARRLAKIEAKIQQATDPVKRDNLEKRRDTVAVERKALIKELELISDLLIPWQEDLLPPEVKWWPPGLFEKPARSPWGPATVIGASGALAEVDWTDPECAIHAATEILVAQTPAFRRGAQRRHVGHLVIAMPHGEGEVPIALSEETYVRMVRHALLSQGADPDYHEWVAVLHRRRKSLGDPKDEEAVHVLWSRVRVDGAFLTNDNALMSAVVGRARWDALAGLDVGRVGIPRRKNACVRRGIRALWDKSLSCRLQLPNGGEELAIKLLDETFMERLGQEGKPDPLSCAGTWTPKRCYRSEESIRDILVHLFAGD